MNTTINSVGNVIVFEDVESDDGDDTSNPERRSLELTPAQWEVLEKLAKETGSFASRGPAVGEPSWRVLFRRIASGELQIE